mgnify:CR=1 FL=1
MKLVKGVYHDPSKPPTKSDAAYQTAASAVLKITKNGPRPKILMAKLGQDGHDRGAHSVGSVLQDLGWEVILSPLFATPSEIADQAENNKVDVIGISSHVAGHRSLIPELMQLLKHRGRDDIIVVVGGVVPEKDHKDLFACGVAAVYGPGSNISLIAIELANKTQNMRKRLHNRQAR